MLDLPRALRVGQPFAKQLDFLRAPRLRLGADGKPTICRLNYVGGRGCAKTTTGIIDMMMTADRMPGLITAWREPRWSDIERIMLTALRDMCPEEWGVYQIVHRRSHLELQWRNGHITHLLSRKVDDANSRVALGSNYAGVWEDEAADKFDRAKMIDIQNAIRDRRAPYLFHTTLSTPVVGDYEAWCRLPGSTLIRASSYDNPYIAQSVIDEWHASMSPELVRQEIEGEFIQLAGRVWSSFVEEPWPRGNIIDYEFRPNEPWYLGCDLGGVQGAYQIVQYIDSGGAFRGRLPIIVAELVPHGVGLPVVIDEIVNHYCNGYDSHNRPRRGPVKVIVGADVATGGNVGIPGAQLFASLGWQWQTPGGVLSGKDVQRQAASSLILNSNGERRMAIAARKGADGVYATRQHFGEGKSRGILQVMRNDTYPPPQSREIFWKDKPKRGTNALEDDRDAFLYWATVLHPPSWNAGALRPAA